MTAPITATRYRALVPGYPPMKCADAHRVAAEHGGQVEESTVTLHASGVEVLGEWRPAAGDIPAPTCAVCGSVTDLRPSMAGTGNLVCRDSYGCTERIPGEIYAAIDSGLAAAPNASTAEPKPDAPLVDQLAAYLCDCSTTTCLDHVTAAGRALRFLGNAGRLT